jgi:hypothetical protein
MQAVRKNAVPFLRYLNFSEGVTVEKAHFCDIL